MAAAGTGRCHHAGGAGMDRDAGPGRVSSQQTPEQPHSASDSPHPLPPSGLLSVTSEAPCSTEKRKA